MPRYFFHVRDGEDYPDEDGSELPDLAAAREHAMQVATQLLKNQQSQVWNGERWRLQVADDVGRELFTLSFFATVPETTV